MNIGAKTGMVVGGWLMASGLMSAGSAIAAESVVLTYGFLSMTIPIADIETFAETGETSDEMAQLLNLAGQDPAALRSTLNEPVPLSPVVLDYALNSPPGEWMLDRISETIQPASGEAGRSAMRAALIGASSGDNEFTLLEVMQVYPSPEIVVQGDRLIETYSRLYEVLKPLEGLAEILGSILKEADRPE
ncbi:MAG TPA: alpha/beta hydrolase [Candidatus Obscuribacterales bacterium]